MPVLSLISFLWCHFSAADLGDRNRFLHPPSVQICLPLISPVTLCVPTWLVGSSLALKKILTLWGHLIYPFVSQAHFSCFLSESTKQAFKKYFSARKSLYAFQHLFLLLYPLSCTTESLFAGSKSVCFRRIHVYGLHTLVYIRKCICVNKCEYICVSNECENTWCTCVCWYMQMCPLHVFMWLYGNVLCAYMCVSWLSYPGGRRPEPLKRVSASSSFIDFAFTPNLSRLSHLNICQPFSWRYCWSLPLLKTGKGKSPFQEQRRARLWEEPQTC